MESITKVFSDLVKPYIDTKDQALINYVADTGVKNLLPKIMSVETYTAAGITYTFNEDGTIFVPSGSVSTGNSRINYYSNNLGNIVFPKDNIKRIMSIGKTSDFPNTKNIFFYVLASDDGSNWTTIVSRTVKEAYDDGDEYVEAEFTPNIYDYWSIRIQMSAMTYSQDITFKPMVRLAMDTDPIFAPYAKTNQQLTKDTDFLVENTEVNGAVNMLPNFRETVVDSGITYTVNANKSVTCNGTATANNHLEPVKTSDNYYLPAGTYKLTGCPSGGTDDTYYQRLYDLNSGAVQIGREYGDGLIFTLTQDTRIGVQIQFISGYTANSLTFKPMITVPSYNGDYVPFAKSNKQLTEDVEELFDRFGSSFKVIDLGLIKNSSKTITVNTTIAGLLATYHTANAEAYDSLHMVHCTVTQVPAVKTIASASNITLDLTEADKITVTNTGGGSAYVYLLLFKGTVTIS